MATIEKQTEHTHELPGGARTAATEDVANHTHTTPKGDETGPPIEAEETPGRHFHELDDGRRTELDSPAEAVKAAHPVEEDEEEDEESRKQGPHSHRTPNGTHTDVTSDIGGHTHKLEDGRETGSPIELDGGDHRHEMPGNDGFTGGEVPRVQKMRGLWGSTAGKSHIAKDIVEQIPKHKTYVEPFAGGASVFFNKERSQVEVLSDINPDVARSFEFVRDATEGQRAQVTKFNWVGSKAQAQKVHDFKPETAAGKFYRFAYKRWVMFMRNDNRITAIDPAKNGITAKIPTRFEEVQARLQGVEIRNELASKVMAEFDALSTFFYLDPPYVRKEQEVGEEDFDEDAFIEQLKGLKGTFLLHYEVEAKAKFEGLGWDVSVIDTGATGPDGKKAGKLLQVRKFRKIRKFILKVMVPLTKVDHEKRLITGIVLEPDEIDAQNDTIKADVIEKAAHRFLARYNDKTKLGEMHENFKNVGLELVESWIARFDFTIDGQKVKKGSWLISVFVKSDEIWEKVKVGKLTGFSIGGRAAAREVG